MTAFGPLTESAGWSALIMATYAAAQGMIVTGFAHGVQQSMAPDDAVAATR
jgi:hypothetical protein